ncbi:hypothetical protein [Afipia carboxidovorans]|uniref:hypothetical protein n=1 Tax=Afipia carboxidovorans TaxID=40137 RepID=UPI0030925849|nr:hypothetical protein CRBSH125_35170 [Afipia carboxidovorans]
MARIRTIKPEFPQSETVGKLSRDARLLFIQLWTIVDDAGRTRAASRMLASLLYPYDDDAHALIDGWLDELERMLCIRRYEVDGSQYLEIIKWLEHQKIDRPTPSRLPEYREPSTKPREPSRALDADLGPRTSTKDQDHSRSIAKATRPSASRFEEFWQAYPRRDGPNPRAPAEQKFNSLVKSGVDPQMMIDEAGKLCEAEQKRGNIGTRFIPQAKTWLNQQRWSDHAAVAMLQALQASETLSKKVHVKAETPQWDAWTRHLGKSPPQDSHFGWYFDSEWPPGHVPPAEPKQPSTHHEGRA